MSDHPHRCPTSCDPDCEISAWGCHEGHQPRWKRQHLVEGCEAETLAANLAWLFDSGWFLQLGSSVAPEGRPAGFWAALTMPGLGGPLVTLSGARIAEAAGKAAEWARERART